jgi:tetratricopeptide (TPR) repeat protein
MVVIRSAAARIIPITAIHLFLFVLLKLYIFIHLFIKIVYNIDNSQERSRLPMPIFTIIIFVFVIILTARLRKNTRQQEEAEARFWEREREANNTRKADISGLDYITIPAELIPANPSSDAARKLQELSGKKILNLTGLSNTDLKLQYGVANLDALSEYDANFTELVNVLSAYAKELLDSDRIPEAKAVLEYAVSIQADAGTIYTMLADIYRDSGETAKINGLIDAAKELNSLSRDSIVKKLSAYLP